MNKIIYTNDHRRNLIKYWRQFYPDYKIPAGFHVHHIKPRCTFEDKDDNRIHHPRNLIALHPDDHVAIHKCRGDKFVSDYFIWHIAGKRWTEASKQKASKTRMGHIVTEETRQKIRIGNTGNIVSDETKLKLREINLGKKHGSRSEQAKQNISRAVTTAMNTPEIREKMRLSHLGNTASAASRQKMSLRRTGTKLFNNGVINKLFRPGSESDGFILGKVE